MAGKEQATQQQAQEPPGQAGRFMGWVKDNHAKQPKFWAQAEAMLRDAVKDIQNTFHQVMYGHPQGHGEPGTPLNPTMQQVTDAQKPDKPANDNNDYTRALEASARQQQANEHRLSRGM